MGKRQEARAASAPDSDFYRITPEGRAATAAEESALRSRYLVDLLGLLQTSGRSVRRRELCQFMPPASLEMAICTLIDLGLIECDQTPRPLPKPAQPRYPSALGIRGA